MLTRTLYRVLRLVVPGSLAVLGLLIGLIIVFSQPQLYEAKAKLWIRPLDRSTLAESNYTPLTNFFNSAMITACELVRSDVVVTKALPLLHSAGPQYRHITGADIRARLKSEGIKDTDILLVTYSDQDPKTAAAVVQSILDAFILVNAGERMDSLSGKTDALSKELEKAKQDYALARRKLQMFKSSYKTVNIDHESNHNLWEQRDLAYSINATRIEMAKAQSTIGMLEEQLAGKQSAAARIRAGDQLSQTLKEGIARNEIQLIELRSKLQPGHPRLARLQTNLDNLRKALADRIEFLSTTRNNEATDGFADEASSGLAVELAKARAQLNAQTLAFHDQKEELSKTVHRGSLLPKFEEQLLELQRAEKYFGGKVSDLETQLAQEAHKETAAAPENIRIIDPPHPPSLPTVSRWNGLGWATLMSLLLGFGSYFLMFWMDPTIDSVGFIRRLFSAPILCGLKPLDPSDQIKPNLKSIQFIRMALKPFVTTDRTRIVVLSAESGEGKSAIAASLAVAYARSGKRVALIDGNLLNPSLHHVFKVNPGAGWLQALMGQRPLRDVIISPEENLMLLALSSPVPNTGLFDSEPFRKLIASVEEISDVLIFDTPPLLNSVEPVAILGDQTCAVVVTRFQYTLKGSLRLLASQLQNYSGNVPLVVVVNDLDEQALVSAMPTAEDESNMEPVLETV